LLMPVDQMMYGVEPDQADENEIDRDDIIEQSRNDQNENASKNGDERGDVGGGDDHK
jgi:hypothetical protein